MEQVHYTKGEVIFREGEAGDHVCLITSGHAEVVRDLGDRSVVLGIVGAGEFVGEMAVVEGRPRSATVRAVNAVEGKKIGKDDFFRLIAEDKNLAHSLIVRLSERLRLVDQMLADAAMPETAPGAAAARSAGAAPAPASQPARAVRMTLLAGADRLDRYVPEEGLVLESLPFVVGRRPAPNEELPKGVDLSVQDSKPFRLSRRHFAIEPAGDWYAVRDLGSHLGTQVNGETLGENFPRDTKALEVGDNTVVAGGVDSHFIFRLRVEEAAA